MLDKNKYHIKILDTPLHRDVNTKVVLSVDYNNTIGSAWTTISGADYGIYLQGDIVITEKFELNEFWLAQGEASLTLIDSNGELTTILHSNLTDLDTIYISIYQDTTLLYRGFLDPSSVDCKPLGRLVKFDFRPRSHYLNETDTYIADLINTTPLGPDFDIDYNFNDHADPDNDYNLVSDVITRIFNIPPLPPDIVSGVTVEIEQNWKYKTVIGGSPPTTIQKNFSDLYVLNRYLFGRYDGAGVWVPNEYTNYGQIIKALAFDFGCFAGYLSEGRAVFLQFSEIGNSRIFEISQDQLIDHEKMITRPKLQYLKLVADSTIFAEVGTPTSIQSKYLEYRIYANIYRLTNSGKYWNINYYLPASEAYQLVKESFLSNYWSAYFFRTKQQFEVTFEINGIDLDLTRQILYEGEYFQPCEITRNITKNTTSVRAIYL
ncbi:MAG: hypothetical protein LC102_09030 [Ignavibacteriales bacterium]|jgi:hypothetical protein|nr:MAG: hypothetical protein F9K26_05325 [Ignavibacteriaceae bacterium]MBW7872837.1 hypothetical protein [Ignavibacteria bacterium]MCZ2143557.1 hypothetical protein [Ignavibacteriales bacterium]OQY75778.1 MAG: hypothetical protein B6D45_05170 [Ignavibacteriales bacterium UTCHB3]MBV6444432.1 hypothetical protein [Ignavibacteriaceae bacterium]